MKRKEALKYMRSQITQGNGIIMATLGNGGDGLTFADQFDTWDLLEELDDYTYDGIVEPAADIRDYKYYNEDCIVVQFTEGDYYIQILIEP